MVYKKVKLENIKFCLRNIAYIRNAKKGSNKDFVKTYTYTLAAGCSYNKSR